jgi:hypothetical protein
MMLLSSGKKSKSRWERIWKDSGNRGPGEILVPPRAVLCGGVNGGRYKKKKRGRKEGG